MTFDLRIRTRALPRRIAALCALLVASAGALAANGCDIDVMQACDDMVVELPWSGTEAILGAEEPNSTMLIALHSAIDGGPDEFELQRLLPDKTLDSTFGNGGTVLLTEPPTQLLATPANGVLLVSVNSVGTMTINELDSSGAPLNGFGDAGSLVVDSNFLLNSSYGDSNDEGISVARPGAIAVTSSAKLLVPAYQHPPTYGDASYAVLQFNQDGTEDLEFGDGGMIALDRGPPRDIAALPDGEFVVVMDDGTASWFDEHGLLVASGVEAYSGSAYAGLLVQSSSDVLLGNNLGFTATMHRFSADGTFDTTFPPLGLTDRGAFSFVRANDDILSVKPSGGGATLASYSSNGNALGSVSAKFTNDGSRTTYVDYAFERSDGTIAVLGSECIAESSNACNGAYFGVVSCTPVVAIVDGAGGVK